MKVNTADYLNLCKKMQASGGAVIVDPVMKRVIAQASADTDHPTRHAVMVCIDQVARGQGGGAWSDDKNKELSKQSD